jgi:hypothetical protein
MNDNPICLLFSIKYSVCVCVIYSSVIRRCFLIFAGFIVMNVGWRWNYDLERMLDEAAIYYTSVYLGGLTNTIKPCYDSRLLCRQSNPLPPEHATLNRDVWWERESELPADGPDCFITLGISSRSLLVSLDENK